MPALTLGTAFTLIILPVEVGHECESCLKMFGKSAQLSLNEAECLKNVESQVRRPAEDEDDDDHAQHSDGLKLNNIG